MNPVETLETAKAINPLKDLLKFGQSVWLDYIRRDLMTTGELKRLIEEDGLRGMTSNPAIFEKAIAGSTDYRDILELSAHHRGIARVILNAVLLLERRFMRLIDDDQTELGIG